MAVRVNKPVIIVGSGPGIGVNVATIFASKRFNNVVLIARNAAQLEQDAAKIVKAYPSVQVQTYVTDVVDSPKLKQTLSQIEALFGPPEFVLFNAGLVRPSAILEYSEEDIMMDFRISTIALHTVAQWAMPALSRLAKEEMGYKPTLMVTSSALPEQPIVGLFSLSIAKAAQKNLTRSLRQHFSSEGIHVCLVTVAAAVSDSNTNVNAKNIANKAWDLYIQEEKDWTEDIRIEEL